ncbi:hypothetical protein NDU88_002446 [Pleurodeles waltl]|uniref:Uncharacterized protein n=1 Tax=Pleurodeles waltl TaxID=8319 RepID=A0AAV7UX39_PLEWA|nr:hypothetical protein NDU88_002446 [Pleurodeles waltl]
MSSRMGIVEDMNLTQWGCEDAPVVGRLTGGTLHIDLVTGGPQPDGGWVAEERGDHVGARKQEHWDLLDPTHPSPTQFWWYGEAARNIEESTTRGRSVRQPKTCIAVSMEQRDAVHHGHECGTEPTQQRKGRDHKPTDKESTKEKADFLRSLQNQECISDTEADP